MDKETKEYRKFLIHGEQRIAEGYDKVILALSGGALGISITFIKDIIGSRAPSHPGFALAAWVFWTMSVMCVLGSFYCGSLAYRRAIRQVDSGKSQNQTMGGHYSKVMLILNAVGGFGFIFGAALMVVFAYLNMGA